MRREPFGFARRADAVRHRFKLAAAARPLATSSSEAGSGTGAEGDTSNATLSIPVSYASGPHWRMMPLLFVTLGVNDECPASPSTEMAPLENSTPYAAS